MNRAAHPSPELELQEWIGEDRGPSINLTWLRYHTHQPIYEVWSQGKKRLTWYSREIKRLADGGWKLKRYLILNAIDVDRSKGIEAVMAQRQAGRVELLQVIGVALEKEYAKRLKATKPLPEPGQKVNGHHGPMVCMTVVDGYVMARRPGCMPFVVALSDWRGYLAAAEEGPAAEGAA